MITRRKFVVATGAGGAGALAPLASFAQQPAKIWRIGMLETTSLALNSANLDAFLKGMRELGDRKSVV